MVIQPSPPPREAGDGLSELVSVERRAQQLAQSRCSVNAAVTAAPAVVTHEEPNTSHRELRDSRGLRKGAGRAPGSSHLASLQRALRVRGPPLSGCHGCT